MKDTFDVLDAIFTAFVDDTELPGIVGITDPTDIALADTKFRRSFADSTLVTQEELDFIDFSFIPSHSETQNYLVNREVLEVNIYTANVFRASLICKAILRIFKATFPEMQCTTPCQAGCAVVGIVRYSFRGKNLVGS